MSLGTCLSKGGLTLINILFAAIGGGLIILGSFMFREYARYGNAGVESLGTVLMPALIVVAVGVMAVILGVIGCVATFNQKKCMGGVYFTLLLLMLFGLITGAVLSYVYRTKIDEGMHSGLKDCLKKYSDTNKEIKAQVDLIQSEFKCCGVDNASDWFATPWHTNQTRDPKPYPQSCCINQTCMYKEPTDENLYNRGCYSLVKEEITSHLSIIGAAAGGFAIILVVGMVMTCVLLMRKRQSAQEVPYVGLPNPDGMRI